MATKQNPGKPLREGWQPRPQQPRPPENRGGYQPTTGENKQVKPPPKKP